jgi:hypothetical protein
MKLVEKKRDPDQTTQLKSANGHERNVRSVALISTITQIIVSLVQSFQLLKSHIIRRIADEFRVASAGRNSGSIALFRNRPNVATVSGLGCILWIRTATGIIETTQEISQIIDASERTDTRIITILFEQHGRVPRVAENAATCHVFAIFVCNYDLLGGISIVRAAS